MRASHDDGMKNFFIGMTLLALVAFPYALSWVLDVLLFTNY